jgi:hypothetical protein
VFQLTERIGFHKMGENLLKRGNIKFKKIRCFLVKKFLEESVIRKPKYAVSNRNPG